MEWKVGIDFGETIGKIDEDEPLPFAIEMIKMLVQKFGPENNIIVSKAGPDMERRTITWLHRTDFYNQTGFLEENVIFVRTYHEKADVVRARDINIFLDDNVKVVRLLSSITTIQRIFWMHANSSEILLIPKEHRNRVAIVDSWARTMKFFNKIPRSDRTGA